MVPAFKQSGSSETSSWAPGAWSNMRWMYCMEKPRGLPIAAQWTMKAFPASRWDDLAGIRHRSVCLGNLVWLGYCQWALTFSCLYAHWSLYRGLSRRLAWRSETTWLYTTFVGPSHVARTGGTPEENQHPPCDGPHAPFPIAECAAYTLTEPHWLEKFPEIHLLLQCNITQNTQKDVR